MKKKVLITWMWGTLFLIPTVAQDTCLYLSLKQCLKTGLESGQSVINARFDKEKTIYQKREALSKGLPQVEGYGTFEDYVKLPVLIIPGEIFGQPGTTIPVSFGTRYNMVGGLKATQLLYSQTYFTALQISAKIKEMSDLNFEKISTELIYDVAKLYYLIQVNNVQRNILTGNITRLSKLLKITESQLKTGFLRSVDFERVKVNRENLITELDNLNILYEQQLELLKYSVGMAQSTKISLTDSLDYTLSGNEMSSDTANNKRPELALIEKQKELALINRKLAASGYYPSLSMYGQYYYQGQRDKFDFFSPGKDKWFNVGVVGLSLNVPIFDGFEKKAKMNQARIDFRQASTNYDFTRRYYNIEYQNATKKYKNSKEAVVRQNENTQLAEKVYEQSLMQYQQGVASLSDLLNAESSLSESRLSLLNATFQLRTSELDMLKASGNLKSIVNR